MILKTALFIQKQTFNLFNTMDLLDKATNPKQYDLGDMDMQEEAGKPSTLHSSHWPYLEPFVKTWQGKDILDIGAGIGWFVELLQKNGTKNTIGIEPSSYNVNVSQKYHPSTKIIEVSFEDYKTTNKFDIIVMLMAIQHIADLEGGFKKMANLLKPDGELFITVPDFDYFRQPRYDYDLQIQEIDKDQYVAMGKRRWGSVADLVRKLDLYYEAARKADFELVEQIPMPPSKELMKVSERYKQFDGKPLTHLLRFKKYSTVN